jgi:hypothetical protein
MSLRDLLIAGVVTALVPGWAAAQSIEGRWSIGFQGGTDIELSGNVHEGGPGTVLDLPTSVEAKSFSDIYDSSFRGQLFVGYGVSERGEIFVRGYYYRMNSNTLQVGTVAGLTLNADFAEYKEWGAELGYRFYFSEEALKPYVAPVAGLRFISELPATFSVPDAGVVLTDVPFFDKSTVGVFGADFGLLYDVSPSVALGIEAGLRYQTSPSRLNGLAGTGLESINDVSGRWSLPIVGNITFRF